MKELSLHILDITQNSIRGKASHITIHIQEQLNKNLFEFTIQDNGSGIPNEIFKTIKNPFTTSRVTRKVGLGIPLLDRTCENCGGSLTLETLEGKGTRVRAVMVYDHIDRPPLGDIAATIAMLITSYGDIRIDYIHHLNDLEFKVCTNDLKAVLGEDVPLSDTKVIQWLKAYIKENIEALSAEK